MQPLDITCAGIFINKSRYSFGYQSYDLSYAIDCYIKHS
nr:MAG TPA: hypothetical protein [Caudoviricetes sp.]